MKKLIVVFILSLQVVTWGQTLTVSPGQGFATVTWNPYSALGQGGDFVAVSTSTAPFAVSGSNSYFYGPAGGGVGSLSGTPTGSSIPGSSTFFTFISMNQGCSLALQSDGTLVGGFEIQPYYVPDVTQFAVQNTQVLLRRPDGAAPTGSMYPRSDPTIIVTLTVHPPTLSLNAYVVLSWSNGGTAFSYRIWPVNGGGSSSATAFQMADAGGSPASYPAWTTNCVTIVGASGIGGAGALA